MRRAFINGKIYMNSGQFAEAVLVEDGVITAVGRTSEIELIAGDAERVDLEGRTMLPGFNDSHCHFYSVGVSLTSLMMLGCTSIAQCIEEGRRFIERNQVAPGRLISGRGWNQDYFTDENRMLDRHDLDKISTEHPIVVRRACGHVASCNSLALERAGITTDTPVPDGGEIRRDAQGNLSGILTENAIALLDCLEEPPTDEEMERTLRAAMAYAASHGITSVHTNDVKNDNAERMLSLWNRLTERGESTVRAYHQCCFTNIEGLRSFIDAGYKTGQGSDMNRIGPIKLFIDGSLGARTAVTRQPYADDPRTTGVLCLTQAQLDELVRTAHESGFQVATHAIGDGGIDMVLKSYEQVIGQGPNTLRHAIIHCQITDMPLLERFKRSDITAQVQPIFLHYDMQIVEDRVGHDLAMTSYAFNTMDELGIHVAYGTDSPVEDLHTINNLHCAVNRQNLKRQPAEGFNPAECVTLEQAIDNYTIGSAYASFDEDKKGRIQPGYLADFCVLDRDIFAIDTSEIMDVRVDMTILGGRTVYTRA
jgi:predicted amidohydrolase YtcJ